MILAAAVGGAIMLSLALVARPLLALLRGDDPTAAPCPACEVTRVCSSSLEIVLGLMAGAWGLHVLLVPGIGRAGPLMEQLLSIVPQPVWGSLSLAVGVIHLLALPLGPWARLPALCTSYVWWCYLAQSAWPLWQLTPAASTYTAQAMVAATAIVFFGYEQAHARLG